MFFLCVGGCGPQHDFPSRPVTLLCPWSAGGGTDRVARQVAVQLEEQLGVPVNVVNAIGGGGVTGHTRGASAKPDGYTLTLGTVELNMLHHRGLAAVLPGDFEPLGLLNRDSAAIFVRHDASWRTLAELENAINNAPRPLTATGTAAGGIWHIAMVGWLAKQGIATSKVTWISINGATPSLQELMASGVDFVTCSVPEARSLLQAGEIRCLGVMSDERLASAPGVPTFREQGVDWALGSWRGLLYPKNVPPERVAKMQQAVQAVANSSTFTSFMDSAGFQIQLAEPEQFANFLETTDQDFGQTLATPAFASASESEIGAYFFPSLVSALALLALIGQRLFSRDRPVTIAARQTQWAPATAVVFAVLGYVLLSDLVGYVITTAVMLGGLLMLMRVPTRTVVCVSIVATTALYQVFAGFLGVPLPWGWFGW